MKEARLRGTLGNEMCTHADSSLFACWKAAWIYQQKKYRRRFALFSLGTRKWTFRWTWKNFKSQKVTLWGNITTVQGEKRFRLCSQLSGGCSHIGSFPHGKKMFLPTCHFSATTFTHLSSVCSQMYRHKCSLHILTADVSPIMIYPNV